MADEGLDHSILESAPDAMVIVDDAGLIRYSNRQVGALFGYAAEELLGQPVELLMPVRFRAPHAGHRAGFAREARPRPMGSGLALFGRRRDGSEFPAEISLSPIEGAGTRLVAAAIRDVTDRKRVEAELVAAREAAERANRAKSRFLAAASHDLRQPLQTLSMLNGALQRIVATPAAADALAHQARAIEAMSRLLNSLLDISKLESGAVKPQVTDFEMAKVFEDLRAEFAPLAGSKGLALRVESCPHWAHGDPALIGQILRNLVANAIKYTREGSVLIRCVPASGRVRIEVIDTGIGIGPDHLPRIFEEFYQVGVSPNATRDGYGLGLSIVNHAVRLIGARLDVQSEPGRGSCFALVLPVGTRGARDAAGPGRGATGDAPPAPCRVLLVEDDAGARHATGMLLRVDGCDVAEAASLEEALDAVRAMQSPPDLVITDYHLGSGVTGLDVIAAVHALAGAETPAIVVTGDSSGPIRDVARLQGLRVLRKPVDADQLLAAVRKLAAGPPQPAG